VYLTSFTVRDIKCFEEVRLDFPSVGDGSYAGWNVLLGTNATGKTTLLQAMAVALIGATHGMRLVSPGVWVRRGAPHGSIEAEFLPGDKDSAMGAPRKGTPYRASFAVLGNDPIELDGKLYTSPEIVLRGDSNDKSHRGLLKGPYAADKPGWLVCGYGSFRRFTGGAENELTHESGRAGRVASLFHESVALKQAMQWLPKLFSRSLNIHAAGHQQAAKEYDTVFKLINALLPPAVRLSHVDTDHVYFEAPGTPHVELLELSDGYRSFLSLVMDLLRQIADAFGGVASLVWLDENGNPSVDADGVVLIDEADLRLHPSWQREIGPRLVSIFPRLQFIVTSHSPFIAQEAIPDGLFVLRTARPEAAVQCIKPLSRVDGWTADEILKSPLFGLTDTRSKETERLLDEHADLRGKEKFERLSANDKKRLGAIEKALAEQMTSPAERHRRAVDEKIRQAAEKARRAAGA
jgi:hypothetical protein